MPNKPIRYFHRVRKMSRTQSIFMGNTRRVDNFKELFIISQTSFNNFLVKNCSRVLILMAYAEMRISLLTFFNYN